MQRVGMAVLAAGLLSLAQAQDKKRIPICFSTGAPPTACEFRDPATNAPIDADRPLATSVAKLDSDVVGHTL